MTIILSATAIGKLFAIWMKVSLVDAKHLLHYKTFLADKCNNIAYKVIT